METVLVKSSDASAKSFMRLAYSVSCKFEGKKKTVLMMEPQMLDAGSVVLRVVNRILVAGPAAADQPC